MERRDKTPFDTNTSFPGSFLEKSFPPRSPHQSTQGCSQQGPPPPYRLHTTPLQPNMYPQYGPSRMRQPFLAQETPFPAHSQTPPYQQPGFPTTEPRNYMPPGLPHCTPYAAFPHAEFDDGARFDVARQTIPPPPPGCMPTPAQIADSQGQVVPRSVKKKSKLHAYFTGGSGGGSVFW